MSGESGEMSTIHAKKILRSVAQTIGILLSITVISLIFDWIGFSEATLILMYLLGVLMVASRTPGYIYGISASVVGVLLFNYFFTAPRLSLSVNDPQYLVTFFVMLMVAIVTSTLTAKAKQQAELSALRENRANMLYQISQSMLKTKGVQDIYPVIIGQLENLFSFPVCLYFPDDRRVLVRISKREDDDTRNISEERERAEQVFRTGTSGETGCFVPVIGQSRILGVIVVACPAEVLMNKEQKILLEAVEEVVAEAVAQVRKRAGTHRISVKMPKDLIMIPMDGNLIEQVLVNLMDNGLKYTPEGSEIKVSVELAGQHIWFEVLDNGNGIAEEDMPHLFDLFYTGGNARAEARKGSGLGLAICQSIVRAHRGEIVAANQPGGGAVFRFSIPVNDPEVASHE